VAESGNGLSSAAEVMKAADKALYKAKNKGRNQVCR
jgi:PleD family two-component response regulator